MNYIENTSDKPTDIISELWDCDCVLPLEYEAPRKNEAYFPDVETATKVYAPSGSTWAKSEFYSNIDVIEGNSRVNHIYPGDTKTYATTGGRSSEGNAPFFNVHKNGKGYIFAIGWTGQWNCEIQRTEDDVIFKSKIEDTFFRVMPGEKFRTSSVVILPYECDVIDAQNKWRHLVKEHFSLMGQPGREYDIYRARSSYATSLCVNYSFSEKENFADTQEKIDFIKNFGEEYFKIRPYFSEDFYPLTEWSDKLDTWSAVQFNRPSENDGVVEVFRRGKSPYETACFVLRGLNTEGTYLFTDVDGGEFTVSGKELSETGLKLTLPKQRTAKIYFYKEV